MYVPQIISAALITTAYKILHGEINLHRSVKVKLLILVFHVNLSVVISTAQSVVFILAIEFVSSKNIAGFNLIKIGLTKFPY